MTLISKFVILSLFVTLFYFIGLLTFITDYEENKCEMTYMFEYPQFVKIKIPVQNEFPRYGLYVYSEGKLTEKARAMKFEGIPVLFVPGNGGSFKQVRSLASVALRKALNSRVGYHFDFFTLDLNGELSGLNGAVLDEQTNFLNHSLYRILDLYDRKNPPNSVVVIGHSMGGVIAQNILDNNIINVLITLSSPHKRPSISLDSYTAKFYTELSKKFVNNSEILNKTIVTIGGGYQDHLVNSWLTSTKINTLNILTTTIPNVWVMTDHASITWCKQFILTINRALFDAVDLKTRQISVDQKYRTAVFKHHLLQNSGTNIRWAERYKVIVRFDDRGEWKEDNRKQYSINFTRGTQSNQWHMIKIDLESKYQNLFVQANNLAVTDWIFACEADSYKGTTKYCSSGIHLSHLSKIAPTTNIKRRTHFLNLGTLKRRYPKVSHVVVRVLPTSEPVSLNFDVHNTSDRTINVQLPRWYSLTRLNVIEKTEKDAIRYQINLQGLQHIIQSYFLYVEAINCGEISHHATVNLNIPWANHDSYNFITETLKKPVSIRLHGSRPIQYNNLTAKVILTLDPTCQYTITIRNSFIGILGQFARFYSPLLVANMAAVILMSYRSQLISLEENKYCSLFQSSLSMSAKPYYLVTSAKLLSKVFTMVKFSKIIPVPDTQILVDENLDFLILPLVLYVTSVGLTYLMTLGLWAGIIMSESTVHKFVGKAFSRTVGKSFKMSDWFLKALHRVPCVVAATLFCLGLTTCGGLALCLGVCYYFLKLSQLGEDFVEGLIYRHVKKVVVGIMKNLFTKIFNTFFKRFWKKFAQKEQTENEKKMENDTFAIKNTDKENITKEINTNRKEIEQAKLKNSEIELENKTTENSDSEDEESSEEETPKQKKQIKVKKHVETNEQETEDEETSEEEIQEQKKQMRKEIINDVEIKKQKQIIKDTTGNRTKDNESKTIDNENNSPSKQTNEQTNPSNIQNKDNLEEIVKENDTTNLRLRKNYLNTPDDEMNNIQEKTETTEIQKTVQQMFEAPNNSEMHFHFTLFLMWSLVAALNIPSVLTWAHNFKYNNVLNPDPSAFFGVVLCACAIPLWQLEYPKPHKKFYKELGIFVYAMAILVLIYGPLNLYRISYILTATFVVTILHQTFAPSLPEEDIMDEDDNIDPIALINEIKTKLE